ncbi:hypothetical protein J2T57_001630 [Natronocella acetinitrilica]|uniref:Uncharacterized protein n=1 Tax=Natronocella acetinitrilica TaxID=414046 RepID=A0AAE3G3J3_9GAMM|nr:hypothetical protein [Natronocella acetinitrilica]MCP1674528.1 hypothetical protein [Natronocella acetinitrilica]
MNSRMMRHLARRPRDMMRYQATGKLPATTSPDSPLIRLLQAIPPRERYAIHAVRLSQRLGYRCSHTFPSAEALLRYLAPNTEMIEGEPWPAEALRDKGFRGPVTLEMLRAHTTGHWPAHLGDGERCDRARPEP